MGHAGRFVVANTDRHRRHRVRIDGSPGPALILVHGFGTDQTVWDRVMPALALSYQIIRLDLAGAGPNAAETFDPLRYAEIESYADDLLLILDELGVERCSYVGASVGGMIGALAAIQQPDLFDRLVMLGASPRYLNDAGYVGGFDQADLDQLYAAMAGNYHEWVSGFAPVAVRALPRSEAVEEFSRSLFSLRPDIALSTARAIFQSDLRDRLPLLETPTSVLQMRNDIAVPMAVGEYLSTHIRHGRLEVLEAEGHFPHLTAPSIVADALCRHLE